MLAPLDIRPPLIKGPKRAPGARHARGSAGSKSPGGPLLGKLDSRSTSLGQSLWPRACSRCAPIRPTDVVPSRHRIGGLDASAGDSRRAPSFTSQRFTLALNCRARVKIPFSTCPGASCLPLLRPALIGLAHRGLGGAGACGRPREAPQALLHHRGCGGRLSGESKGPHGS